MNRLKANPRLVTVLRWTARVWSLVLLATAVLMFIFPDPAETEPIATGDAIVLGMWGLSVIGLLLGWRWERLGAVVVIAGVVGNAVGFRIVKGDWYPNLNYVIIPLILFVLPAVAFLACRAASPLKRKTTETASA